MCEAASFIRLSVVPKPWLQTGWRKRFLHVCGCACIFSVGLPKSLFLLYAARRNPLPSFKKTFLFKVRLENTTLLGYMAGANVEYHLSLPDSGGLTLLHDI